MARGFAQHAARGFYGLRGAGGWSPVGAQRVRLIGYMVRLLSENRQATSTNAPMMTVAPTALQAMLNGLLMAISSYRAFTGSTIP